MSVQVKRSSAVMRERPTNARTARIQKVDAPALAVSFDPQRRDFEPYGLTCVRWTPSPMRRPDHHNEIELNLLESGWVTYLLGGRKVRVEPGRLAVFWAAIPHQIVEYGQGTRYFVATIPFAWFLQCRLPEALVRPLVRGDLVAENEKTAGAGDRAAFARWETDLKDKRDEPRRIVMLEMEARLRRLALGLPPDNPKETRGRSGVLPGGDLSKVEQMACLIAQRYTEPLTAEEIARAVNLHPNYAMALFKKAFGTTLMDYVTHHRVSHAQRLLATTDEKIVEIAFSSGFNSLSRFNEAFRRACGCTPRTYRANLAFEE